MPQFDPTIFAGLVFWLAIAFTGLYLALSRVVLPRLQDTLDQRAGRIAADLDRAEALRAQAQALQDEYETALQDARDQAKSAIQLATADMERESAEREAALTAELDRRLQAAEQRIAKARDEARSHIRDIAIDACQAASERVGGVSVDAKVVSGAVDQEMARRNLQVAG